MGFIYLITCSITGLMYVGQTINPVKKRWREHRNGGKYLTRVKNKDPTAKTDCLYYNQIRNILLYNAMAEHGVENFKFELIDTIPDTDLNDAEIGYIIKYKSLHPTGYNATEGGESKYHHTKEAKALMRAVKAQNIENNRSEELKGMPMYVTIGENQAGPHIRIQNHPLCKDKYFYTKKYTTLDNAKEACRMFIADLEKSGTKYKGRKTEEGLPKGIKPTKKGYKLDKVISGEIYRQGFESQKYTREQNKQRALDYYADLMKTIEEKKKAQRLNVSGPEIAKVQA